MLSHDSSSCCNVCINQFKDLIRSLQILVAYVIFMEEINFIHINTFPTGIAFSNSYGFTMWMAGGGIKGGISVGETDELGSQAETDRFHVKRLHATILNQLGLDPNNLTYFHGGLDKSLVGVEGAEPIHQVIA